MFIPLLGLDCDGSRTECPQMNRYCNSKPFKSPILQAGGEEGGGCWAPGGGSSGVLIVLPCQSILLIFICLGLCLLNNNV